MDPEDDKKQERIGNKVRLVSRKRLKKEDEEQMWGKWRGTVKTEEIAPEDKDPGARSSWQDCKGDAREPEVAGKTASRCRQDRKGNAQEPEVAGKTAILGWPPAASVCATASGSGSLSVSEPVRVEKPRLVRVCKLVRVTLPLTPPPCHVGPDKHSAFRARCKEKGQSFAMAMLQGHRQRLTSGKGGCKAWVAKAVAKGAVAKPAATSNENSTTVISDTDLKIRAGGYDKCTLLRGAGGYVISAKTTKAPSRADAILRNDHRIQLASASRSRSPKLQPKPPASRPPLHLRIEYLVSRVASGMKAVDCSHEEMLMYLSIVDEIGEKKVKDCSRDELIVWKNLATSP